MPLRVFVVDLSLGRDPSQLIAMINPSSSSARACSSKSCLSLPGFNATVLRPARAVVKGLDREGQPQSIEGSGLLARAFHHEIDHLEDRVFIDRLRGIKRDVIVRKIQKLQRTVSGDVATPAHCVSRNAGLRGPTLQALIGSRHNVVVVVSQPDRPRRNNFRVTPTKAVAEAAGLPVLQPERVRDEGFLRTLSGMDLDLGVVAAYVEDPAR